tara:strand:- start:2585 stop:3238 length:654 start_codon:yes stop_codon:yes gene_type:complete
MVRLLFLIIISSAIFHYLKHDLFFLEVKDIEINGDLQYADITRIREEALKMMGEKNYDIDLREKKKKFEEIAWVKNSQISFMPPDKLQIFIIEHKPLYIWNDRNYVNLEKDIFYTENLPVDRILRLSSNDFDHLQMYDLFESIQSVLIDEDLIVREISKQSDIIVIRTDDIQITVKHSRYFDKINELTSVFPELVKKMPNKKKLRIDLRYPTGFAVQ